MGVTLGEFVTAYTNRLTRSGGVSGSSSIGMAPKVVNTQYIGQTWKTNAPAEDNVELSDAAKKAAEAAAKKAAADKLAAIEKRKASAKDVQNEIVEDKPLDEIKEETDITYYDGLADLGISVAKPDISGAFFKDSYSPDGEVVTAAENEKAWRYIYEADPVDYLMDQEFNRVINSLMAYQEEKSTDTEAIARLFLQQDLTTTLDMINEYNVQDYAQEYFMKRGEKEFGVALNLQQTFDTYLT